MKLFVDLTSVDLQLFADGGADGASGASAQAGSDASGNSADAGDNQNAAGSDAGEGTAVQDRATMYAQFKNDYKSEIEADTQRAVRGRLKTANEFKNKVNPLIGMLAMKYGCDASDIDSIRKAMDNDESYYSEAAMKRGMTVEQYKQFNKIERENEQFKAADEARRAEVERIKSEENFNKQVKACKSIYPSFDANVEAQNPKFARLVRSGVDLQTAYEVTHRDEIVTSAMQAAAKKSAEQVAASVAANVSRPSENGLGTNTPVVTSVDISKLSREQMEDMKARARRGEKITFKK